MAWQRSHAVRPPALAANCPACGSSWQAAHSVAAPLNAQAGGLGALGARVAAGAGHLRVPARERVAGLGVVEADLAPRLHAVAASRRRSRRPRLAVSPRCGSRWQSMQRVAASFSGTTRARARERRPPHARGRAARRPVALVARDREVRAPQRVGRLRVVLRGVAGRPEALDVVAALAASPVGAPRELAAVGVAVAVAAALVLHAHRAARGVALLARHARVAPGERIGRAPVVEARGPGLLPRGGVVARDAVAAEPGLVHVRVAARALPAGRDAEHPEALGRRSSRPAGAWRGQRSHATTPWRPASGQAASRGRSRARASDARSP